MARWGVPGGTGTEFFEHLGHAVKLADKASPGERLIIQVAQAGANADPAKALLGEDQVRAIAPEVGGGFGAKINIYGEEYVAAAVTKKLGAPVKWIEERSEAFVATTHGRDIIGYIVLGTICVLWVILLAVLLKSVWGWGVISYHQ